jgi:hypothetical protein
MRQNELMMTLEKQVRIPANRHIHVDIDFTLSETWTPGEVVTLLISPIPQTASTVTEEARDTLLAIIEQRRKKNRLERNAENISRSDIPFMRFRGSCEGLDTLDAYFKRRHAEHEREKEIERRRREESVLWQKQ